MKTMGQEDLWLVSPRSFPHADAVAMAAGADDVLARARVVSTLSEAVADCGLVLGTSARIRSSYHWPVSAPREAAPRLLEAARTGPVALVFGTERTGLTNEEFERCHALVHIPANPVYESLNLAQAVQILAYELMIAAGVEPPSARRVVPLATLSELDLLNAHFDRVLTEVGFTDRAGGPNLVKRLARIFNRAELDQHEVNILRGFLAAVEARGRTIGNDS
jgi:TrmH family RNA methyltransferase